MKMNAKMVERRGMTGLETAIILVAFVITAAAFSFVVLNMGFLTAQKSQTVISSGMEEAASSLMTDGDLLATCDTTNKIVNSIQFYVRLSAGKEAIDTKSDKLVVSYTNPRGTGVIFKSGLTTIVSFDKTEADTDDLIETGERWKVTVNFNTADTANVGWGATNNNDGEPAQYETFRVTFKPVTGSAMIIERSVPPINTTIHILE
jgi:flagellin FlaB